MYNELESLQIGKIGRFTEQGLVFFFKKKTKLESEKYAGDSWPFC